MSRKFKKEFFDNLEVIDINKKGKGVVKSGSGKVIFVDGVVPGDYIQVETYKKRKGYFEGNLIKINKESSNRIIPICEHFDVCGGCKWQNLNYETQLKYEQLLRDIEKTRAERLQAQMFIAQTMAPEPEEGDDTPSMQSQTTIDPTKMSGQEAADHIKRTLKKSN